MSTGSPPRLQRKTCKLNLKGFYHPDIGSEDYQDNIDGDDDDDDNNVFLSDHEFTSDIQ